MTDILERFVADDFTLGQIKAVCRCKQCSCESIDSIFTQEICHNGTYCKKCIQSCKLCQARKKPIPYLQQLLKNVQVKCIFAEWGCNIITPFELISSHEASCNFHRQKGRPAQQNLKYNQASTKASFLTNIEEDTFPNIDFVNENLIPYPVELEEITKRMINVERKLEVVEAIKPMAESKLLVIINEITHKFEESEKSIEESLKQFCEKYIVDRDFLWKGISNAGSQFTLLEEEIMKLKHIYTLEQSNLYGKHSSPNNYANLIHDPNTQNYGKMPYQTIEEIEKNLILKNQLEAKENSTSQKQDDLMRKISMLSNQIYEICKSQCDECSHNELNAKNIASQHLCTVCNKILCSDCTNICKCLKCGKRLCKRHSMKCHICSARVCRDKECMSCVNQCKSCGFLFCKEHMEIHNKLDGDYKYKIYCTSKECKVSNGVTSKTLSEIASVLMHTGCINDLYISTWVTQGIVKLTNYLLEYFLHALGSSSSWDH